MRFSCEDDAEEQPARRGRQQEQRLPAEAQTWRSTLSRHEDAATASQKGNRKKRTLQRRKGR